MSTAILKLAENGKLQEINEHWFCKMGCPGERRKSSVPNQLHLSSFWGLYILCGTSALTAFVVFLIRVIIQFVRYKRNTMINPLSSSSSSSLSSPKSLVLSSTCSSQVIYDFLNFINKKEEAIKRTLTRTENENQP